VRVKFNRWRAVLHPTLTHAANHRDFTLVHHDTGGSTSNASKAPK
jgi:hypothetical protein